MGIEKAVKGAAAEAAGKATDTKETQKPQSEWKSSEWCDYGLQKLSFWKQYGKKSDLDEAIRAFKKALELDPSNKKAKEDLKRISQDLYLLGMQAYANGDYKTAIEYFKQALELDKNNEKARDGLAKAEKMERFGEETGGIVLGGAASPTSLALALFSAPTYNENIRKKYLLGVDAYVKGDYLKAIKLWGEIYDQLKEGDPAREKLLDYINRARKKMGQGPLEPAKAEQPEIGAEPRSAEGAKPSPPTTKEPVPVSDLNLKNATLYRIGESTFDHEKYEGFVKLIGNNKPNQIASELTKCSSEAGRMELSANYWFEYIKNNVLSKEGEGPWYYFCGRKNGVGDFDLIFYNDKGEFYKVSVTKAEVGLPIETQLQGLNQHLEFKCSKLNDDTLADFGFKLKRA